MTRSFLCAGLASFCVLLSLSACSSSPETKEGAFKPGASQIERARFENLRKDGRDVVDFDLNNDGKVDQWQISAGDLLVRVERDLNFDGTVDLYLYPNNKGDIVEEEMDLDKDGVVDVVNYYREGVLSRKEMSVDFTGRFTVIKFYDTVGKLSRIERDSDNSGRVDTWEYYQDDKRIRTGRDNDGDGTPDVFDEDAEAP